MVSIKVLLYLLVFINMFGFVVGIASYWGQLAGVNPALWIFIPDCPLYVLLASAFYLGLFRNDLLRCITAIGLVKYGTWTLFALAYYSNTLMATGIGWMLFVEHIGMSLQVLLLAKAFDRRIIAVSVGWFLLNDFVDYAFGLHPYLPSSELLAPMLFAVAGTLVFPWLVYRYGAEWEKNRILKSAKGLLGLGG